MVSAMPMVIGDYDIKDSSDSNYSNLTSPGLSAVAEVDNLIILIWPDQESNLGPNLRRVVSYPLNDRIMLI